MTHLSNLHADLASSFDACATNDECFELLCSHGREWGYSRFHYRQVYVSDSGNVALEAMRSAMGTDYARAAAERRRPMRDPLVAHCVGSARPKLWSELPSDYKSETMPEDYREKIRLFMDLGLQSGVSVRLKDQRSGRGRYMAGVSLIRDRGTDPTEHDREFAAHAHQISVMLDHFMARLDPVEVATSHFKLSDREHEALSLLSEGFQVQQIADRMSLSDRTAAYHLANMRSKLRAQSNAHAVAIALRIRIL